MRGGRAAAPLAAGIVAAAVAFTAVLVAGGGDGGERAADAPSTGSARSGRSVFLRMGCGSCHRLEAVGSRGDVGPDLDGVLPNHTRATLTRKIVDPGGGSTGVMPDDFGERMSRRELSALVDFLLASRTPQGND